MSQSNATESTQLRAPADRGHTQEQQRFNHRGSRIPGEGLSLNEMLRVMDVARELRRNRDVAEEMFRRDEVRAELRAKLMKSAAIAGDRVTESEIDAAIDQYFTNLNTYTDPPSGLKSVLAHTWVWRRKIFAASAALTIAIGGLWYLFLSPNALLSGTVRTQKAVAVEKEQASQILGQIKALTTDPGAINQADALYSQIAEANPSPEGITKAIAAKEELARLQSDLSESFEVHVATSATAEVSGVVRAIPGRKTLYYLIVEARDANGNVIPRMIRNSVTGQIEKVMRWGEEVPAEVYERLKADKESDGILGETLFATKIRGNPQPVISITDSSGAPLTQGSQLTPQR